MASRLLQILVRSLATVQSSISKRSIALANFLASHPNAFINTAKRLCPTTASTSNLNLTEAHYTFAEALLEECSEFAALRYYCCPKILTDTQFWGCYFYLLAVERSVRHEVNLRNKEAIAAANAVAERQRLKLSSEDSQAVATPQRAMTIDGPSPVPIASGDVHSPEAHTGNFTERKLGDDFSQGAENEEVERRVEINTDHSETNAHPNTITTNASPETGENYTSWFSAAAKLYRNAESHLTEVTSYLDDLIAGEDPTSLTSTQRGEGEESKLASSSEDPYHIPTSSEEDNDDDHLDKPDEELQRRRAAKRQVLYSTFVGFSLEEMPSSPATPFMKPPSVGRSLDDEDDDGEKKTSNAPGEAGVEAAQKVPPHSQTMYADRTKMFANSQLFDELMRNSVAWSGVATNPTAHPHSEAISGAGHPIVTKVQEPEDCGYEGYF